MSQPVRIAAVLGLAGALGLGGIFMLLGHKGASATAPVVPRHRIHHHHMAATQTPGATKTTAASPSATQTGSSTPSKGVKQSTRPAAELAALNAGLPARLAHALGQAPVVVVSLSDPQSEVDGIAFAEARAGARLAGAAFVPLNVLSQADVGKLTEQLGQLLPDPGILVYTRPAKLAAQINGFADKDTVAQAALNAVRGL